jgi:hypothetical protein
MTEPSTADSTPARHTCSNQTACPGPDWECPRCSTLPDVAAPAVSSAGVVQLPPTNQAAWVDGDPLLEAIAAAVWEHCRTEGTSLVVDDPRNIAVAAASALPAPVDRAAVLTDAERTMLAYALDQAQERIWSEDGFTDEDQAAVDSLRRMAAEAPATEEQDAPLRCVCGDPVQLMDDNDPASWIHSPGSDTRCLDARPRCPHCRMPHDLDPASGVPAVCASILASIRDRDAAIVQPAQPRNDETQQDGAQS